MNNTITNHSQLKQRISELQASSLRQEQLIRQNGSELIDMLHPVNIIKKTVSGLARDSEVRKDALSMAMGIGSDFVIGRLLRSNKSVKGLVFTEILGKLASRYINGNSSAIKDFIGKAIHRFLDKKNQDQPEENFQK